MDRSGTFWEAELLAYPYRKEKDLAQFQKLDRAFGHPHRFFQTIHVGGTNGKGSVCLKIAKTLEKQGYKTGLYTSPHLFSVCERIQVNGIPIAKKEMQELFFRVKKEGANLSFFDVVTMIAFLYFQKQKVDYAVIEVGLGGRFDATNVIQPCLAVITSIRLDHTELLGNTLAEIAFEKGGIAKEGVPLIVGPTAAPFFPMAKSTQRAPFFDVENQWIARKALEFLPVSQEAIEYGLLHRPPCRFEIIGNCVFDVAHNPDGFSRLREALRLYFPKVDKFRFIVAFSKDKDWKSCIDCIAPIAEKIIAAPHDVKRLEDPRVLSQYHRQVSTVAYLDEAVSDEVVCVFCGSFYFLQTARLELGKKI